MISVILPSYNEEKMIAVAARRIGEVLLDADIDYELVFVNDGSSDRTWKAISKCASLDERIRGVSLSRNFGKEAAIFAGLEAARGDAVVVMDVDLQHPAEKIPEMVSLWQKGYEVVEGIKKDRGNEKRSHAMAAGTFYKMMSKSTGVDMNNASDFKLLDRKVVDTLNNLEEKAVFFRALSYWAGYKRAEVTYAVADRTIGKSKWSTKGLVKYAINNVTSFTSAPLHIVTILGIITLIISIIFSVITLVQKFTGTAFTGFTTVILLILLLSSIVMISLGIIGAYIAKIYDEVKGRPKYIISETTDDISSED